MAGISANINQFFSKLRYGSGEKNYSRDITQKTTDIRAGDRIKLTGDNFTPGTPHSFRDATLVVKSYNEEKQSYRVEIRRAGGHKAIVTNVTHRLDDGALAIPNYNTLVVAMSAALTAKWSETKYDKLVVKKDGIKATLGEMDHSGVLNFALGNNYKQKVHFGSDELGVGEEGPRIPLAEESPRNIMCGMYGLMFPVAREAAAPTRNEVLPSVRYRPIRDLYNDVLDRAATPGPLMPAIRQFLKLFNQVQAGEISHREANREISKVAHMIPDEQRQSKQARIIQSAIGSLQEIWTIRTRTELRASVGRVLRILTKYEAKLLGIEGILRVPADNDIINALEDRIVSAEFTGAESDNSPEILKAALALFQRTLRGVFRESTSADLVQLVGALGSTSSPEHLLGGIIEIIKQQGWSVADADLLGRYLKILKAITDNSAANHMTVGAMPRVSTHHLFSSADPAAMLNSSYTAALQTIGELLIENAHVFADPKVLARDEADDV